MKLIIQRRTEVKGLEDVINEIKESRTLEPLKRLKEENHVQVAAHFGITPAVGAPKSHILVLIGDHCVENNTIDEVEEKPIAETAEVVRLKLDFEREERRLAGEEAQRACEAEKALQDAQLAAQREEAQSGNGSSKSSRGSSESSRFKTV